MKKNSRNWLKKNGKQSKGNSRRKSKPDADVIRIVVDCSTLAYAAFYSYGHLSYNQEQTGVIFGFLSKVLLIAEEFNTSRFVFCWDSIESLYREKDYKGYKEKRHEKRKELTGSDLAALLSVNDQREVLRQTVLPALGFRNSYLCNGFEADDLLAVWSRRLSRCWPVVMVTTDMDMYQCLDCCSIYNPSTKKVISEEKFRQDYCIAPEQWAYAKAIGGCDGDGVTGIVGVADPKSTTSKSLKYIRGELTKGKIYNRITSKEGREIIETNLPIVTTPYRPELLPRMIIRRDKLTTTKFMNVFEQYGMYSFLKPNKWNKWKDLFLKEGEDANAPAY